MRSTFVIIFMVILCELSSGQGTMLLRQPTLSGDRVAFVYANDIWQASINGGDATRMTSSVGAETNPHFSPDGLWIAFTAQYDGNTDVYYIPSVGGEPVRLTWHPGADIVQGWTPDSKRVVFQSGREGNPVQNTRLFSVSLEGGTPESLPLKRAAGGELSPDGRFLAYTPNIQWDSEWRNYRGGQAQPIWIVDMETLELVQTPRTDNERHMDPVWSGSKVCFISERDYAANIWSYEMSTGELKQLTFHGKYDVKNIDSDGARIIYEQGGLLHLLDMESGVDSPLEINVRGDFHWARERWENIIPGRLQNPQISPTGKRAIFEYRGEILTVPADKGSWRNISNSPGSAERYPVWSPAGDRIAWFSDISGEYELLISDQDGYSNIKKIGIENPSFFFRPEWSPDAKYIAFTDTHYNLLYVNVLTGEVNIADTDNYAHPNRTMNPVWSPDSKWIAYPRLLDNQYKAIMVFNVETGLKVQLTDGLSDAISPVWDESGKYIWFLASTNYGLGTGWLDMSSYDVVTTRSLYLVLLNKEVKSPFLPESDEEEVTKAKEEISGSKDKKAAGRQAAEKKADESGDEVRVIIEPENIQKRIVPVNIPEGNYTDLLKAPADFVFVMEAKPDNGGMVLNKYSLKEMESKPFIEKISNAVVSSDRKKILYQSGSSWAIADTKAAAVKSGEGSLDLSGISIKIDPEQEWHQIFREGWRYQRDFLYVDNVHGAPWNEVYDWYSPWVDHVRHRSEMNYIIDILGGEVSVGHSFTSGGDFPDVENVPCGLLGADFEEANGRFRIRKIYDGESWNPRISGPLAIPGMEVAEGNYLIKVNGREVRSSDNLYSYFEGTAGQVISISVSEDPSGGQARKLLVKPVSSENQLRMIEWVESNRRMVDQLSGGRLAYVWLPNTGRGGFNNFNRYYFAQQDKQGAVIDERNNGGGSAADYIVDVLSRELMGYFNSRAGEHKPITTPMSGIWGPKVMVVNESAGSGGDLMPYLFREMGIGPLVGTRTWGGLVGTWDTPPFVDGGRMVAPRGGFFDKDGNWAIEGVGVAPDVEVMQSPRAEADGHDPQLEKAVEVALKLLESEGVKLKKEPDPPVRWFRPDYFKKN